MTTDEGTMPPCVLILFGTGDLMRRARIRGQLALAGRALLPAHRQALGAQLRRSGHSVQGHSSFYEAQYDAGPPS